jgi:L,D-transpeptidase catalytic domain
MLVTGPHGVSIVALAAPGWPARGCRKPRLATWGAATIELMAARRLSIGGLATVVAIICVCALTPAAVAALPTQLSNETTFTRWASPATTGPVRSKPIRGARVIAHLHYQTEDKQAEVYLALRSATDKDGNTWILVRVPGRPNGRKGWVREDDLNPLNLIHTQIIINTKRLRLTLKKKGKKVMSAPVGVGRPSLPTPKGNFWVREKLRALGVVYGPWAIGTSAYSPKLTDWPGGGVVGIHGTNEPSLIPGRPSHGCVRMKNKSISRLVRKMPLGTPIKVI